MSRPEWIAGVASASGPCLFARIRVTRGWNLLQMDEYIDILSGESHFSNGNDEFWASRWHERVDVVDVTMTRCDV